MMKRSFVALKKSNGYYVVPKFSECLIELFNKNDNSVNINWSLENGKFTINENEEGYELRHSPECPIKLLSKSESGKIQQAEIEGNLQNDSHIGIATSVVIESVDNHVLLTKRAQKLRASPNVWVTPGGYIENLETVFNAGAREVKEETGLDISETTMDILGLWENVYPLLLGIGSPKTHVLVVYTHVMLNETHENLTSKIIPNPEEVDSYCWLSSSIVAKLFSQDFNEVSKPQDKQFFIESGKLIPVNIDYSTMFNRWLWSQPQSYSGVNFALRKWLEKTNENATSKL